MNNKKTTTTTTSTTTSTPTQLTDTHTKTNTPTTYTTDTTERLRDRIDSPDTMGLGELYLRDGLLPIEPPMVKEVIDGKKQ